jgi:hypothetical protein
MDLAADPAFNGGRCRVTHVVAAGAPVTHIEPVAGTRVLTVENTHDLVTHLDNEDSRGGPATAGRVDVAFKRDLGSVVANHDARLYAEELTALQRSTAPALRDFLGSLDPYLVGSTRTTGWRLLDGPPLAAAQQVRSPTAPFR